ncbi:MAG: MBL fold metallo-hydrolase [Nannocystaceae bacterium]
MLLFRQLFDPVTSTYTYLLADPGAHEAVLIDPVKEQVDRDVQLLRELGLELHYTLETHVHADHITAAGLLRRRWGCRTVVARRAVAESVDVEVVNRSRIYFGARYLEVRETPGHTDGCVSYVLDDQSMAFTGDALLIRGCGRTDFQLGDPRRLYKSVHERIFSLPDETYLYPGHDYKGRTVTTVGEEKAFNPRLGGSKTEDEFVEIMRGLKLALPRQIDVAVPANLRCGIEPSEVVTGECIASPQWAPIRRAEDGAAAEVMPEWVAANRCDVRLVDVRDAGEFDGELGHLDGAVSIPLAELGNVVQAWDRELALVVVCRTGLRSACAAVDLEDLGFRRVASMHGGMRAWRDGAPD